MKEANKTKTGLKPVFNHRKLVYQKTCINIPNLKQVQIMTDGYGTMKEEAQQREEW